MALCCKHGVRMTARCPACGESDGIARRPFGATAGNAFPAQPLNKSTEELVIWLRRLSNAIGSGEIGVRIVTRAIDLSLERIEDQARALDHAYVVVDDCGTLGLPSELQNPR